MCPSGLTIIHDSWPVLYPASPFGAGGAAGRLPTLNIAHRQKLTNKAVYALTGLQWLFRQATHPPAAAAGY